MTYRFTFGQTAAMYLGAVAVLITLFVAGLMWSRTPTGPTASAGLGSPRTDTPPAVVSTFPETIQEPPVDRPATPDTTGGAAASASSDSLMEYPWPQDEPAALAGDEPASTPPSVVPVEPQVPAAASTAGETRPAVAAPALPDGEFTIQVAAHSTLDEANRTLNQLRMKGFEGVLRSPRPGDTDRLQRVWVGSFGSIDEARPLEARLQEAGFQTYVRRVN